MAMDQNRLIAMANQIARNFAASAGDHAAEATAQHIRDFWDPRMKAAVLGADRSSLNPIAAEALAQLSR